jgi:hypothetical protein
MGDGDCYGMVGGYSNAVKGQLGEVPVLGTIFPNVCLMGSGHTKSRAELICQIPHCHHATQNKYAIGL